jgi:hypothetical protein
MDQSGQITRLGSVELPLQAVLQEEGRDLWIAGHIKTMPEVGKYNYYFFEKFGRGRPLPNALKLTFTCLHDESYKNKKKDKNEDLLSRGYN